MSDQLVESITVSNAGPAQYVYYVGYNTANNYSYVMLWGFCPECKCEVTSNHKVVIDGHKCFHKKCFDEPLVQLLKQLEKSCQ